ncbi:MAG: hypothetical protein ACR2JQ_09315 [Mycobacteriales bacterium]
MTAVIPTPLRAVAGLAAATIDEARALPRRLVTLPVVAVSNVLQASLAVQQRYADLVVRGDGVLAQLRPEPGDGKPAWATFDDEAAFGEATAAPPGPVADGGWVADQASGVGQPPIEGYDDFTVAQLRARFRRLSEEDVAALLDHEAHGLARPAYLTMLSNRLDTLRSAH